MKKIWITLLCCSAMLTMPMLTACDNELEITAEEGLNNEATDSQVPEGYFRATFFPQPAGTTSTRAIVNGESEQIQSLVCLIYRKKIDDAQNEYYEYVDSKPVITYTGTEATAGNITPQTYVWPLKESISFTLPKGEYKAVFVGNADRKLFEGQGKENEILTNIHGNMDQARINMPDKGPLAFNDYNMFYLCTVDFNALNPSPAVLMQRVVSNNVFSRKAIDANAAVSTLAQNLVNQIRANDLTTEVVQSLLHTALLEPVSKVTGLDKASQALTKLVDRLVNLLLGDVVQMLNAHLLQELTTRLQNSLKGTGNIQKDLLGLSYIMNPWSAAEAVDVTYTSLPRSIDFNRNCRSLYNETTFDNIPVKHTMGQHNDTLDAHFSLVTLCGPSRLKEINIDSTSQGYTQLLAPTLDQLDDQILNGLLVNIHVPLNYAQQSNLQYSTSYELLNLTLNDFKKVTDSNAPNYATPVGVTISLKDIVNLKELVKRLLGDNILSTIVGGLTDKLLEPLVEALNQVVIKKLDIQLPGLGLSNIVLEGTWDATYVSDGTVAPTTNDGSPTPLPSKPKPEQPAGMVSRN